MIIPTLNESEFIARTIQNTLENATNSNRIELIVIDSGSIDTTIKIVESLKNVSVYLHPELKGKKYNILNKGAQYASGDVYIFLDADTLLPDRFDELIIGEVIEKGFIGGAFEFKLDTQGLAFRLIELVNRIRYRIGQRYYGDQAIFCSREAFKKVGGFPDRLILESAYFCAALRKSGQLKLIKTAVITSSRRFTENQFGPLWVLAKDIYIFLLDKLGIRHEKLARKYWEFNDQ